MAGRLFLFLFGFKHDLFHFQYIVQFTDHFDVVIIFLLDIKRAALVEQQNQIKLKLYNLMSYVHCLIVSHSFPKSFFFFSRVYWRK